MRLSPVVLALFCACPALAAPPPASDVRWPSVATEIPRQGGGEADVAVVVGVTEYLLLPRIEGAADNARDWAQHLVRTRGLRRDRVTLLVDAEATRERIERALQAASRAASPQGRLWFIFVGHGAPSPGGDDGLILGADAQPDADSLAARGLTQWAVEAIVEGGAHSDAVVVYDACFSGRAPDGGAPLVKGLQATVPVRKAPASPKKPVVVLASSESFAGPLPGEARPAFSYLLLGAARGWANDGRSGAVDVGEAYRFVHDTISSALKASARLPVRRGPPVKLALAAKATEPSPDVTALLMRRCPDGTRWGGRTCAVVDCPEGTSWDGAACKASTLAVACPAGTSWNGTACVAAAVACPAGTSWNGSTCVPASVTCPSGTSWNGSSCAAAAVSCPAGTSWNGSACAAVAVSCPAGTAWNGSACAAASSACPPSERDHQGCCVGTAWNGYACAAPTTNCPLGMRWEGGRCVVDDGGLAGMMFGALGLPAQSIMGDSVVVVDSGVRIKTDHIFVRGSVSLTAAGEALIREIGAEMTEQEMPFRVECYADASEGAPASLRSFTEGRARTIAGVLASTGVAPALLRAVGHGNTPPPGARVSERRCDLSLDVEGF